MKEFVGQKQFATGLSIVSNTLLIALKIVAGVISGSISIISEAIHSFSDLFAALIAYISVSMSSKPADDDHSYGHGKYEDLSGFIEGGLIILAALYIAYEAVLKILSPQNHQISVDIAIIVMGISSIVNTIVSIYLFKIAKKTGSVAIYADAEHLRTDVISSFGVCIGLLLIKITDLHILDPIIALIVAVVIFIAGAKICDQTKNNLVDKSLSEEEVSAIRRIIEKYLNGEKLVAITHLRTRKSGVKKNIDIKISADPQITLADGHALCDEIENDLENMFGNTDVTIHLEPFSKEANLV